MKFMKMMKCAAVDRDTVFDDADPYPKELIFSPGEGKKPISLFTNKDIEYLAFPTIFCGERHKKQMLQFITVKSVNMN